MNKKIFTYILGALLIAFGILFVVSPSGTFETIVIVFGAVIILFSVIKMFGILKSNNPFASFSITGSIIGIVFGFILIVNKEAFVKLIPILLGIWLLLSGISTLLFLLKSNSNRGLIVRPIFKIIIGVMCLCLPIIPVVMTGILIGSALILSGGATFINVKDEEVVYKVKIKK